MENIPTETVEFDGMTRKLMGHCMRTPTVLRSVLEQFSNRELLTLSLVNKQWNFEARSVLQNRGDVTARIDSREHHKSLVAFALDLTGMRVVPFSGIHIELNHYYDTVCQSSFSGSMDPSIKEIVERLPWNHLVVIFSEPFDQCKDCQALKMVQKILKDFQGVLEELSFTFMYTKEGEMYQHVCQDGDFPRLTTLKVAANSEDKFVTKFLKALVPRAPNLRALHFHAISLFQENVLEGSSAVLVPTVVFHPIDERMCESLIKSLRAETIKLTFWNFELEKELLNKDIPMALQASRMSLKTLHMDLLFAVPLMCYGIYLENVTKLEILVPRNLLESIPMHVLTLFKRFNFTCVFPKLQQVEIESKFHCALTTRQINDLVEPRIAGLRITTSPHGAVNIKHLTMKDSTWAWDSQLPFWAQTFPHVQTFSVQIGRRKLSQFPFTILWEKFVNLEELIVENIHWCASIMSETANLDSVFCGIFPEEVAELLDMDDEYLKAVNIVPVMPSITCMKSLRTLRLDFIFPYPSNDHRELIPCPTFLFSRVTDWIGFARCPAFAAVTFSNSTESYENLSLYCH